MSEEQLYDRQIRLWGPHGQASVQCASLYVCGSDGTATEFLKTMLLHGVKNAIIVDDAKVADEDLMTNFFTDSESVGKNRAEVAAVLLSELNPFAKVKAIVENPDKLPEFDDLKGNVCVLTTGNRTVESIAALNEKCRAKGFKQLHIQSTGFFGAFYIDGGLHHLIEGAGQAQYRNEMRILNPFPELAAYWDSFDLDKMDDRQHSHCPYTVILHQARKKLMNELGVDKLTYKDKPKLEEVINSMRRRKKSVVSETEYPYIDEASIDDALDNIASAFGTPFPPPDTMECFRVLKESVPEDNKEPFWRLVRGAYHFFEKHGVLPHYGQCPDMETLPEYYREHKRIYQGKSQADWEEVLAEVGNDIDPEYVQRFAKNIWRIGGVAYKPIGEYLEKKPPTEYWDDNTRTRFNQISCVQLLFIAARHFLAKHGRNPGNTESDRKELLDEILSMGADATEAPKFTEEFCRYNGTTLPSVVATLTAVLAEEATKLIIQQVTPMKGLVVYDALHGLMQEPE